ncbi:MAG TPA: hypothetical protein VH593_26200, partial [Ktedonobacteraceae bacterium]
MRTCHHPIRFSLLLGWMLLLCGVGSIAQHQVARAAAPALPPGYALSITESASTMTYGGPAPNFQAQLTVPAGENPLQSPNQFFLLVDAQSVAADSSTSSGSTYTFTVKGSTVAAQVTLPVGSHTAVAKYFSSVLNQTLASAPVSFTVQKYTPTLTCYLNAVSFFAANAPVNFSMGTQGGPPVDWQNATYSITFVGPQTFTDSNLTADSSGGGTASVPPVPGTYKYQCAFSGTSNFNAAQTALSNATLIVTQGHQVGIKLYSNPTTITGGITATLEIVVSGGAGLPTPTGSVALFLGPYNYTSPFRLSGGRVTQQVQFPSPLPSQTLRVYYYGDAVYAQSYTDFPLTNPPL